MVLASLHSQFWQSPLGEFSINAEPGSYAVAGLAATTLADRLLSGGAVPGVYDVTGLAATLERGFNLDAGPGAYDIIGLAATALAGRLVSADPGFYAILGQDAGLLGGFVMVADSGVYEVAGGTVDIQIAASGDDGHSFSGGAFTSTFSNTIVGDGGASGTVDSFHRFTNVEIPQGATITAAHITVVGRVSPESNVKTNIYLEDADDAVAPTTQAEHAADVRTSAFTAWDDVEPAQDVETDSPDIASVLQEIIDRDGWSSGQSLMILWDDDGSGANVNHDVHSYDGDTTKAVKLHVEWSVGEASLLKGSLLVADSGVHTVTGLAAVLTADRLLVADAGLYVLTGADAELIFATINLTGNITRSLRRGR